MDGGQGKDESIFWLSFSVILIFEPCDYITYLSFNLLLICPLILNLRMDKILVLILAPKFFVMIHFLAAYSLHFWPNPNLFSTLIIWQGKEKKTVDLFLSSRVICESIRNPIQFNPERYFMLYLFNFPSEEWELARDGI